MVTIIVNKKKLLHTLKMLNTAVSVRKNINKNTIICEITVTDGKATFVVPGAIFSLDCVTQGAAKTTIPFWYFYDIIKNSKSPELAIKINYAYMNIGAVTVNLIKTTFFEDDSILRSVKLPINYNDSDLLHLIEQGYTPEELKFNGLDIKIDEANEAMLRNIKQAHKLLSQYSVSCDDLKKFVENCLYPKKTNEKY